MIFYKKLVLINILSNAFILQFLLKKDIYKINKEKFDRDRDNLICSKNNLFQPDNNCYSSYENNNIKIIHLIITRFMIEFYEVNGFPKKLYLKDYLLNGIRVLKKYLLSSLENQTCKEFIWILMVGDKTNISHVKSMLSFNYSFDCFIVYKNSINRFIKNITKGYDVLISTRIDYDDQIYYDAVNDVRKAVNINKPMVLYGYNRGVYYFEFNKKYYEFYKTFENEGVMSVFASLIVVLNKVNNTYTVYDLGNHMFLRKQILNSYKLYGIKKLNYEPAIFDNGAPKFIYVRQKYSGGNINYKQIPTNLKEVNFSINKFFGKS